MSNKENKRNIGIDCVKALAVLLVIIHHIIDCGIVMSDDASVGLRMVWYCMRNVAYSCVNLFVLVTGFLCVTSPRAGKKLLATWLQVLFTGAVITSCCSLLGADVTPYDWVKTFCPIITGEYWYITAYFLLCILMPILNQGLNAIDKQYFKRVLFLLFIGLSVASLFVDKDPFVLKNGYSFAWMLVVYLFGAYWRLYVHKQPNILLCFSVCAISSLSFLIPSLGKRLLPCSLGEWCSSICPFIYTSPFTLAMALSLFGLCLHIEKENERFGKIVSSVANVSLGMYIWLVHPVFWREYWRPFLGGIIINRIGDFIIYTVSLTGIAFVAAFVAESLRKLLFALYRVCPSIKKR